MQKLASIDAAFLYNETERCPQHIGSVQVVELPGNVDEQRWVEQFRNLIQERVDRVPYFTRRLQRVPFDLDHPVWVRDPCVNVADHVRHAEVAPPGGRAELEARIAELHERPLDRDKPMWEIWVLTGLEGGRAAYYHRVHHACIDGVSGQAAVEVIMDSAAEPPRAPAAAPRPEQACRETAADMLIGAAENLLKFQLKMATGMGDLLDSGRRLWQRSVDPSKGLGAVTEQAPLTPFNRLVDSARTYAIGDLSLSQMKSVAKASGTTVNEVFLAVCSGGIRRYLRRIGELPQGSLIAGCPVSLRKSGEEAGGNRVTMMLSTLATDEPDPIKRLLKIRRSSLQGKGFVADAADTYDADVALPGLPWLMRTGALMLERAGIADVPLVRMPFNLVVSNVPGPRRQLYSMGARVIGHYPVSIPAHALGVNITVQSYVDQMCFGITASANVLPMPDLMRDDMLEAFSELRDRVLEAAGPRHEPAAKAQKAPLPPRSVRPGGMKVKEGVQ